MARLAYDDSAFVYFAISMGCFFLLPFSYWYVAALWRALKGTGKQGGETVEKGKLRAQNGQAGIEALKTRGFAIRTVAIVVGWLTMAFLVSQTGSQTVIQQFDPWQVLGVTKDSTKDDIKRAYRRGTFKYHPDRVRNKTADEQAVAAMMLQKVQDANNILTNKEAYEAYLATGSPDGSKQMEVSIGLPEWLMRKENHNLVLVIYLIVLVVIVPVAVGSWYSNSKLYADKMILNDTYRIYIYLLGDKALPLRSFPEVLALSAEYRQMPARGPADQECLEKLRKSMMADDRMPKKPYQKVAQLRYMERWPSCDRANVLIHAYLNRRTAELTPGLQADLDFVLVRSKVLIGAMNEAVQVKRNLRLIRDIANFEQHMTQALYFHDSSLQQLPHFGLVEATHATMGKGAFKNITDFLAALDKEESPQKGMINMTESECKDVYAAAKELPRVELEVTIGVVSQANPDGSLEFEEQGCEGDIMTALCELHRKHVPEGCAHAFPVRAPFLPYDKTEEWTVLFTKKNESQLLAHTVLKGTDRTLRGKIQFPSKGFLKPNQYQAFDFYLVSNAYLDVDIKTTAKAKVLPEGTIKPAPLHDEDLNLDNEPTLFEEAFGKLDESDDSDFKDSDDEDDATEAPGADDGIAASDDDDDFEKVSKPEEPKKTK
ncbi:DnaJ protein ERDJ2A (Chaperone protein dnaJ 21) (AtDjC21) (AtJ21) (Endoplasmic reticulum dnaJ domain-containing protein 2A) (AtERdj2A) (Translocation protein SEC63 homolog ERDJ2A) [Durusdinium trenchii]|uniref:DnaJ protein ERDJ2A (Chaperone protein dnaJ 21) (AtDjC21) (AtJ21) (Endoplasmic reticulum dnaJ domain-containing protein 2A) (AtERdj2A) (Translocation protein SEC63 homolog ERDJ2A) n=1 Tax=Durusdinium trenchii TaxID=1381693 RepID=A0ABP0KP80_9DINO